MYTCIVSSIVSRFLTTLYKLPSRKPRRAYQWCLWKKLLALLKMEYSSTASLFCGLATTVRYYLTFAERLVNRGVVYGLCELYVALCADLDRLASCGIRRMVCTLI